MSNFSNWPSVVGPQYTGSLSMTGDLTVAGSITGSAVLNNGNVSVLGSITGSGNVTLTRRLGLGTAAPSEQFHALGTRPFFRLQNNGTFVQDWYFGSDDSAARFTIYDGIVGQHRLQVDLKGCVTASNDLVVQGSLTGSQIRAGVASSTAPQFVAIGNGSAATPGFQLNAGVQAGMWWDGTTGVNLGAGTSPYTSKLQFAYSGITITPAQTAAYSGSVPDLLVNTQIGRTAGYLMGVQNNSVDKMRFTWDGRMIASAPNSAPNNTDLMTGSYTIYVDEGLGNVIIRVRKSTGAVVGWSGTLA